MFQNEVSEVLGENRTTSRGFELVEFTDRNGVGCSLQQSSAIGDDENAIDNPGASFVWLGTDEAQPMVLKDGGWVPYPIPDEVLLSTRMHLNRQQVEGLMKRLSRWLDTGSFQLVDDVPCPACSAKGEMLATGIVYAEGHSGPSFQMLPCPDCGGKKVIPSAMLEWQERGKEIRRWRRAHKLTLHDVAERSSMLPSEVSKLECGRVDNFNWRKLLRCEWKDLPSRICELQREAIVWIDWIRAEHRKPDTGVEVIVCFERNDCKDRDTCLAEFDDTDEDESPWIVDGGITHFGKVLYWAEKPSGPSPREIPPGVQAT